MASANTEILETSGNQMGYTVPLTEAAENGAITPDEYVRQRAKIVGRANILENLIVPLFRTLLQRSLESGEKPSENRDNVALIK